MRLQTLIDGHLFGLVLADDDHAILLLVIEVCHSFFQQSYDDRRHRASSRRHFPLQRDYTPFEKRLTTL